VSATTLVRWPGDHAEVVVTLPLKTVSEMNMREHWAPKSRRAAQARMIAKWSCSAPLCHLREGLAKGYTAGVVVTLTRIAPRALDDDNLRSALKAVRDGVTDALGLACDRDARLTWAYAQERGRPKEYAVRVVVSRRESP
jgi:hypothetical protein